jgi:hypothetical protein
MWQSQLQCRLRQRLELIHGSSVPISPRNSQVSIFALFHLPSDEPRRSGATGWLWSQSDANLSLFSLFPVLALFLGKSAFSPRSRRRPPQISLREQLLVRQFPRRSYRNFGSACREFAARNRDFDRATVAAIRERIVVRRDRLAVIRKQRAA